MDVSCCAHTNRDANSCVWTLEYFLMTHFMRKLMSYVREITKLMNELPLVLPWRHTSPADLNADWLSQQKLVAEVQISQLSRISQWCEIMPLASFVLPNWHILHHSCCIHCIHGIHHRPLPPFPHPLLMPKTNQPNQRWQWHQGQSRTSLHKMHVGWCCIQGNLEIQDKPHPILIQNRTHH